jgi:hypothetical protein
MLLEKRISSAEIIKPQNFEEKLIWYGLLSTYVIYLLGAQPIFFPVIAWILVVYLGKKFWDQDEETPESEKIKIPIIAWIWVIFIPLMVVALIFSHIDFNLGVGRLIRSLVKWGREWGLWAIFPLIACLNIRPKLLYRAVCIVCLQSLFFIILCYLAYLVRIPPGALYVSPFHRIGGGSRDFYSVLFYFFDGESGQPRLSLFTPWSPTLALTGMIYFFLVRQELNPKWRMIGTIGAVAMVVGSLSRMAMVSIPLVMVVTWALTNFDQPVLYFTAGLSSALTGIFASEMMGSITSFVNRINQARASSSKLRFKLAEISLYKWRTDAPIWGHGFTAERGPGYTLFFPIGTSGCGTWVNVLYTKGIVGFIALAVPLICTFFVLTYKASKSEPARVGLRIFLVLLLFSITQEVDVLSYVNWPGLLMIGLALKD